LVSLLLLQVEQVAYCVQGWIFGFDRLDDGGFKHLRTETIQQATEAHSQRVEVCALLGCDAKERSARRARMMDSVEASRMAGHVFFGTQGLDVLWNLYLMALAPASVMGCDQLEAVHDADSMLGSEHSKGSGRYKSIGRSGSPVEWGSTRGSKYDL
jgi:hypothetical protein